MSKKLLTKKLNDSIYQRDIYILCGDNEEANKWVRKRFGTDLEYEKSDRHIGQANVLVWEGDGDHAYVAWVNNFSLESGNIAAISHELNHLTYKIMDYVGMRLGKDSEEAYTYYQDSLVEQTIEAIKEFKKK